MKSKKVLSMVLAAGIVVGGMGFSPIKALAATGNGVQAISSKTEKELKNEAYKLLKEVKANPTETNIKAARVASAGLTDKFYKSSYDYLLDLYVSRSGEKPAIDELMDAYAMNMQVTKAENEMNFEISVDGENMSEEEQREFAAIQSMINNMKFNMNAKSITENETKAKISGNINMNIMGQEVNMKLWANVDASGDTPQGKYIIQIPELMKVMANLGDKDYIVCDLEDMMGTSVTDMDGIMKAANAFNAKFTKNFSEFMKVADAKYGIVEEKDKIELDKDGSKGLVKAYTLTLTNEKLMNIIKDALQDEEMIKIIKDYVDDIMAMDPEAPEISDEEFYTAIQAALPTLDELSSMIKFDINSNMGINKEGYISYEDGSIKFTVNADAISKALPEELSDSQEKNETNTTYIVTIKYDANSTNINGDVQLEAEPELTEENSLNLDDLTMVEAPVEDLPVELSSNK